MAANTTILEGKVILVNGSGFKINQYSEWLNLSKYAKPADVFMPRQNETVRVHCDGQMFVRKVVGIAAPEPEPTASPEPRTERFTAPADGKDLRITRLACINSATNIIVGTHGRADADEVLALAAKLESWVLR